MAFTGLTQRTTTICCKCDPEGGVCKHTPRQLGAHHVSIHSVAAQHTMQPQCVDSVIDCFTYNTRGLCQHLHALKSFSLLFHEYVKCPGRL